MRVVVKQYRDTLVLCFCDTCEKCLQLGAVRRDPIRFWGCASLSALEDDLKHCKTEVIGQSSLLLRLSPYRFLSTAEKEKAHERCASCNPSLHRSSTEVDHARPASLIRNNELQSGGTKH